MQAPRRRWIRSPQPHARGAGFALGVLFLLIGIPVATMFAIHGAPEDDSPVFDWLLIGGLLVVAVPLVIRGLRKGRHAAFVREHGVVAHARVVDASRTGVEIGDIPLFCLTLEVDGESGSYTTTVNEVLPPEDVDAAIGATVHLRVNPNDPKDVLLVEVGSRFV